MCRQNDEEPSKEQAPETEKALNLKKCGTQLRVW